MNLTENEVKSTLHLVLYYMTRPNTRHCIDTGNVQILFFFVNNIFNHSEINFIILLWFASRSPAFLVLRSWYTYYPMVHLQIIQLSGKQETDWYQEEKYVQ